MFCPQCGQQQVTGAVRFCSRCGFPLDGVIQLLSHGGMLPVYRASDVETKISPRKRGVKQGGLLLLSGAVLVPILGVLSSFARNSNFIDILVAFAAIICFLGGPLRMLFAAVFEEGGPNFGRSEVPYVSSPAPRQFSSRVQSNPLPPASVQPPPWRPRPITAELAAPPSVTENTTRLLDKEDSRDP
ncbi:MAG: hypothetical protein ABR555_18515 [Pyrinomonadaceae bacterium]